MTSPELLEGEDWAIWVKSASEIDLIAEVEAIGLRLKGQLSREIARAGHRLDFLADELESRATARRESDG